MQSVETHSVCGCAVLRFAAERPLPIGWRTHWVSMPAMNVGHISPVGGGAELTRKAESKPH